MAEWEAHDFQLRINGWWADHWNKLDKISSLLFVIGTGCRFGSHHLVLEAAKIILAFDLFIFYFRFLEYLTFVKNIGPNILMIGRMV